MKISVPGRICLFGEDLDYTNLEVITAAINLRMYIKGDFSSNDYMHVKFLDIKQEDKFHINQEVEYRKKREYIRSVFNVLNRNGYHINKGVKAEIWSELPIGRGLSSSSVLTIAWIAFLNELFQFGLKKEEIAELAYMSEVLENNEGGGNMDHYACSLGNGMYMDCSTRKREMIDFSYLANCIVIGDTNIVKKQLVHTDRKININTGFGYFSKFLDFDVKTTTYEELEPFFSQIPEKPLSHARAIIKMRDITREAYKELTRKERDHEKIGQLINDFHRELIRGFNNSTEMTEKLISESMKAGALGGKIIGSGFGGCVLIYCPEKQQEIANIIEKCGGKPYIVSIDEGIRRED
ncbi:MAG: hypothetical protein EAX96_10865 [Candidatus Lokiarchaeota archaeon]|nr:hypothetical protein [Candidatus Lokiarchaeota archaeon]